MLNKTKIYIFHPYSRLGGADLSIARLINKLNSKKYSITFITLTKPFIQNYLKKKIEMINLNTSRSIFSIFKIRKILINSENKYKKVILISNQNFANLISCFAIKNLNWIKLILIERNNPIELNYYNGINKFFKNKIILILMTILYKKANAIVGISKGLSRDLSKIINKKVITIYNPAFDKLFYNGSEKKIEKKRNEKIILNVGRLEPQKNHLMLIRAYSESLKSIDSKLIIVGYGSEEELIKKYIINKKLINKVKIFNKLSSAKELYKKADLFVLTSLYEGFGNVLVEAGIFKIPIISTNCKSGPSEILKNGRYGDLVKINDYKTLSKKIVHNLKNPNKVKINRMYNSLKRFNLKKNIYQYEKLFEKI